MNGLSIIITFGLTGFSLDVSLRMLRISIGLISLTITLYDFEARYHKRMMAFRDMCIRSAINFTEYLKRIDK